MINARKLIQIAGKWKSLASKHRRCTNGGYFVAYSVDRKRFVLPLDYLGNSVIRELLKISEDVYGLPRDGPIMLPCNSSFMSNVLFLIQQGRTAEIDKALRMSASERCFSSCSYAAAGYIEHHLLVY